MGQIEILRNGYLTAYQWVIPKPLIITRLLLFMENDRHQDDGPVLTCFAERKVQKTNGQLSEEQKKKLAEDDQQHRVVFDRGRFNVLVHADKTVEGAYQEGETATHTTIHAFRHETSSTAPLHAHITLLSWDAEVQDRILKCFLNNLAVINYISRQEAQLSYLNFSIALGWA